MVGSCRNMDLLLQNFFLHDLTFICVEDVEVQLIRWTVHVSSFGVPPSVQSEFS